MTWALVLALLTLAPPPSGDGEPAPMPHSVTSVPSLETSTLSTPRFTLVYTPQAQGAARFLANELEHLRDEVGTLVGRDWPGVTEVRLGSGREEYEALALPNGKPPPWAVALAYPEANVVLVEAHSLIQGDGQLTLRHELVHVALGQLGRGWPRWYQEGLAMELTGERKFRFRQYEVLSRAVTQDRVFRFDDLANGFPKYADDVEIAYAQSAAFVEFLSDRHGQKPFGELIDRMQQGDGFEKAFGIAFHTSLSMEERVFRAELPRKYPWWPLLLSGGTLAWGLSALLLIVAFVRRQGQLKRFRAEQTRVEHLEDLGALLLASRGAAANDDLEFFGLAPVVDLDGHWVVHAVRHVQPQAVGAKARPARTHGT
jgi:hypothetical protein